MLSRFPVEIYCDFDGTITIDDMLDTFLERFATTEWLRIEKEWREGNFGSRECLSKQLSGVKLPNLQELQDLVASIKIDPSFANFVQWSRSHDVPISVVSDGIDFLIEAVLKNAGIPSLPIYANQLTSSKQLNFPYEKKDCTVKAGLCKCSIAERGNPRATRIFIGNGLSDLCVAGKADMVFAKSELVGLCREKSIPLVEFKNFDDIIAGIELHFLRLKESSYA